MALGLKKLFRPLDKLDLIEYIYIKQRSIYGKETYNQRQAYGNQDGATHLQGWQEVKLLLFVILVLLGVFYPPITILYTIIGLIYLVKAVAK